MRIYNSEIFNNMEGIWASIAQQDVYMYLVNTTIRNNKRVIMNYSNNNLGANILKKGIYCPSIGLISIISLDSCTIRNNNEDGIHVIVPADSYTVNSWLNITNSIFQSNNKKGIYLLKCNAAVTNSIFANNTEEVCDCCISISLANWIYYN
jgi:hypothetical protein